MAAELVETTRLYARTAAAIEPEWVEAVAGHLLKRSHSEPHWEKGRGQVAAYERVTLFGLTLIPKRKVNYGPINPDEAREIFLRFALTEGDFDTRAPFWRHNRQLIDYVHSLEEKSRRRDLLVDQEAIYGYYAARVPAGIYSTPQFEQWLRNISQKDPKRLHMRLEDLLQKEQAPSAVLFPDALDVQGMQLPLVYRFDPQSGSDGVTLKVPRAVLNQVSEERSQWLVPGLLRERVIALLRGLPKAIRKSMVPVPDYADACLKRLQSSDKPPSDKPLTRALAEALKAMTGVHIPEDAWDESQLPDYLRLNLQVLDEQGRILEEGRDLLALKKKYGGSDGAGYHRLPAQGLERDGITRWDFGPLPETVELDRAGIRLRGYPALVDQGESLALRVLDSPRNAAAATHVGLRRLIQLALPQEMRYLRKNLPGLERMRLQYAKAAPTPEGLETPERPDLEGELLALVVDLCFLAGQPPLRDAAAFEQRIAEGKARLIPQTQQALKLTGEVLDLYQQARQRLAASQKPAWLAAAQDIQQQLDRLVFQGFLRNTPPARLSDLPRYLKGILLRLEKLPLNPGRDRQWMDELGGYYKPWQTKDAKARHDRKPDERLEELRWMFEELRISLFAQELKTAYPISVKRLERRWRELGM
jgi:ATP-dependent helicase HrpA